MPKLVNSLAFILLIVSSHADYDSAQPCDDG